MNNLPELLQSARERLINFDFIWIKIATKELNPSIEAEITLAYEKGKEDLITLIKSMPSVCGRCDKKGTNPFGECKCSYEDSGYIRKSELLSALTSK